MSERNERSDHDLGFAQVTQKVMPNGEVRTRMKLPDGLSTTITHMPNWKWEDDIPWQEAHFHKGLTEDYLVLAGWVCIMVLSDNDVSYVRCLHHHYVPNAKAHVRIDSGIPHCVLLGPDAVLSTVIRGVSIGNASKNGNDWWPYHGFEKIISRVPVPLFRGWVMSTPKRLFCL